MIDTLYTLNTIPLRASIRDSILTNSTLSGDLNIDGIDSLNLVLSGAPSVNVVMPEQTDWAMIIGLVSIFANIIVLVITIWSNKRLQEHETEEIRTRKIQEIAIEQQAELYSRLIGLANKAEELITKTNEGASTERKKKAFDTNVEQTKLFLTQNSLYVRNALEAIASEILNIYSEPGFMYKIDTNIVVSTKLKQYSDVYNNPYIKWQTRLLQMIQNKIKK